MGQNSITKIFVLSMWTILVIPHWVHSVSLVQNEENNRNRTGEEIGGSNNALKDSRGLFSPRMDYEQWTPLGRGDPLKNDPTYDYVPPVLERVHYWIDPASRKPDPPGEVKKTEILVLGVSSKKPSTGVSQIDSRRDTYDPFLKFIEGPKFNHHTTYSRPSRPQYSAPSSYYSSSFYSPKQKYGSISYSKDDQHTPYTVMMPPPMQVPNSGYLNRTTASTFEPTTTTEAPVSISAADLVYHTSSASNEDEWKNTKSQYATIAESSSQVTWKTPLDDVNDQNITDFTTQLSESDNETDAYTESLPALLSLTSQSQPSNILSPSHMQMLHVAGDSPAITHVSVGGMPIHKGQVTDDTIDPENTYVNIGKPNAHVQTAPTMTSLDISTNPILGTSNSELIPGPVMLTNSPDMQSISLTNLPESILKSTVPTDSSSNSIQSHSIFTSGSHNHLPSITTTSSTGSFSFKPLSSISHLSKPVLRPNYVISPTQLTYLNMHTMPSIYKKPPTSPVDSVSPLKMPPVTLQTMETMQTMQPPPATNYKPVKEQSFPSLMQSLLYDEDMYTTQELPTTPTTTTTSTTTTSSPPTTVQNSFLTTDPLFSHFQKPAEAVRGPMYLIIQGHSKVKTYGASKQNIHGIPIQESNEISHTDDIGKSNYIVKHLHDRSRETAAEENTEKRNQDRYSKDLQTLQHVLDTGLGAIDVTTLSSVRHKRGFEVQETEVRGEYNVRDGDFTSEKYRKGIVETGDISEIKKRTEAFKNTPRVKRQLSIANYFPFAVEKTDESGLSDSDFFLL